MCTSKYIQIHTLCSQKLIPRVTTYPSLLTPIPLSGSQVTPPVRDSSPLETHPFLFRVNILIHLLLPQGPHPCNLCMYTQVPGPGLLTSSTPAPQGCRKHLMPQRLGLHETQLQPKNCLTRRKKTNKTKKAMFINSFLKGLPLYPLPTTLLFIPSPPSCPKHMAA